MNTETETEALACPCGASGDGEGWLNETWPTIGGGKLHVVSCPSCRRLASPYDGSGTCSGRCGGRTDSDTAYVADCLTCAEAVWSCWDLECVRAHAGEKHPQCETQINCGSRAVA